MSPAITALVVAIAGMMFPAIAERKKTTRLGLQKTKEVHPQSKTHPETPKLTLYIKAALHVHAEDVHSQVGCSSDKVHGWRVILVSREEAGRIHRVSNQSGCNTSLQPFSLTSPAATFFLRCFSRPCLITCSVSWSHPECTTVRSLQWIKACYQRLETSLEPPSIHVIFLYKLNSFQLFQCIAVLGKIDGNTDQAHLHLRRLVIKPSCRQQTAIFKGRGITLNDARSTTSNFIRHLKTHKLGLGMHRSNIWIGYRYRSIEENSISGIVTMGRSISPIF